MTCSPAQQSFQHFFLSEATGVAVIAGLYLRPIKDLHDFVENHIQFKFSPFREGSPEDKAQTEFGHQFKRYLQLPSHPDSVGIENLVGQEPLEHDWHNRTLRAQLLLNVLYKEDILPANPDWTIMVRHHLSTTLNAYQTSNNLI
jgi:hypothetical protein